MNKVELSGRLTRDPAISGDEEAVARYTLAVRRRYSKDKDAVDYVPCVAFSRQAKLAQGYLKKGSRVIITGRIQTGSYVNDEGTTVYYVQVVVEDTEFDEPRKGGATGPKPAQQDYEVPDDRNFR